jgi:hypothetical protein
MGNLPEPWIVPGLVFSRGRKTERVWGSRCRAGRQLAEGGRRPDRGGMG